MSKKRNKKEPKLRKYKYLEEMGLKRKDCSMRNYMAGDKREKDWVKIEAETGVFDPDCWCFYDSFAKYLYSNLCHYLKTASKMIDLDYHKFTINGKEYTQRQAIKRMIEHLEIFIKNDDILTEEEWKKADKAMRKAMEIWVEIYPAMWW